MDIKERLRRINANSFYGVCPIDRNDIIKEVDDILRRKKMAEINNNEAIEKEQYAAEDKEWGSLEERIKEE